jgi:hypothetical protein
VLQERKEKQKQDKMLKLFEEEVILVDKKRARRDPTEKES